MPQLIARHQLHDLPGKAFAQTKAQTMVLTVGGAEIALQGRNQGRDRVEQTNEIDLPVTLQCHRQT